LPLLLRVMVMPQFFDVCERPARRHGRGWRVPAMRLLLCLSGAAVVPAAAEVALPGPAAAAAVPSEPYTLDVWASVLFGPDGRARRFRVVEADRHPDAFIAQVEDRLLRARIAPPLQQGQPASFRTGVQLRYRVTPREGGGDVTLQGLAMAPLPTRVYFAAYPQDIGRVGGWTGAVTALCRVGVEGRCTQIEVQALPGMPESVRRYARASLEGWTFEPQELAGQPVPGEYSLHLQFETGDDRPDDIRWRNIDSINRGR
jgi:hypothetical protein